jgi:hypothetical protein
MTRDDDDDEDHIHMRPLLRIGAWGVCALVALGTVVLAGRTEIGEQRLGDALAALKSPGTRPSKVAAVQPAAPDSEAARLAETVRALVADRDRLSTRVAALEHNLSEITGSVARDPSAARSGGAAPATPSPGPDEKTDTSAPGPVAAVTPLPPQSSMPSAGEAPPPPSSSDQPTVGMTVNVPLPRPAPLAQIQSYVTSGTRTTPPAEPETRVAEAPARAEANPVPEAAPREFAIDLAAATNVNALRARWGTIKGAHPALLDGLRPLVSVRESTRPGFTEFHLVAGPLADAAIAERLCAALTAARSACKVAVFDGQGLDLR